VALVECALADLMDVGAVGVHAKEVAHYVAVAHAILRLARRGENNAVIGQIQRIEVRYAECTGKLPQPRAVGVDFVDMVIIVDVFPHGKDGA
jgi:hypothetical protein